MFVSLGNGFARDTKTGALAPVTDFVPAGSLVPFGSLGSWTTFAGNAGLGDDTGSDFASDTNPAWATPDSTEQSPAADSTSSSSSDTSSSSSGSSSGSSSSSSGPSAADITKLITTLATGGAAIAAAAIKANAQRNASALRPAQPSPGLLGSGGFSNLLLIGGVLGGLYLAFGKKD